MTPRDAAEVPRDRAPGEGWRRFAREAGADARLVLFCAGILALFRVVLVWTQRRSLAPESGWSEIAAVLLHGLRFDAKIAGHVALPSFAASLACLFVDARRVARAVRRVLGTLFVLVTVPVCAIDLAYLAEFHAQFDRFVLGAVFDDLPAVLRTVWKTHPVVPALIGVVALSALLWLALRRALAGSLFPEAAIERAGAHGASRVLAGLAIVLAFAIVLRGSTGSRPVQKHDAAVTRDPVLNGLAQNPWTALLYAVGEWRKLTGAAGLSVHLRDGDVRAAAGRLAPDGAAPRDLDDALLRRAPGPRGRSTPRHVVLVLMESYDAWTLGGEWAELHLADEMKSLGQDGILLDRVLSASSGTMTTLAAILTGLADAGVVTNYQPTAARTCPSSIAPIFERLGYRTRLFYGGYLSWERIGDFAREQGFDEVYGAPHMAAWRGANEWGARDEQLFAFVDGALAPDVPSFDVVITTSNHPPYDIDVWAAGWPVREVPAALAARFAEGNVSLHEIGHHAYADRAMGAFVRRASARLTDAVFAVTGDHYSRKFPGARPSLYERSAVPLLLYGPAVLAGVAVPPRCAGSHLDVAPTLIGLCAPAGFEFHALGRDLLDPSGPELGFGLHRRVISPDWIAEFQEAPLCETRAGCPAPGAQDLERARTLLDSVLGVAWWRIMRGPELPAR